MEKLHTNISIEQLQGMMADLILSQRETDKKFQATDKKFQATDKKFQATDKKFQATDKLLTEKFQATDKKFQATDKLLTEKFQATDKKFQTTERLLDKQIKERKEKEKLLKEEFAYMKNEVGGIGNSNGAVAEDFFANALSNNLQVANMHFDYIDFNLHRKKKQLEAEYDIILYNHYKILIIEVKYNFKKKKLRPFYESLKKFRSLYPEYSALKLYGAVAALTYDDGTVEEAKDYGFYVLSQNNKQLRIINETEFTPNEIK